MRQLAMLGTLAAALIACGDSAPDRAPPEPPAARVPTPPETAPAASAPAAPPQPEPARPDAEGRLRIEVGDALRYSVTRFEVTSGKRVRIELVHTGKLRKEAMGHNIVILQPGTDIDAFSLRAVTARDTEFIPPDADAEMVVHSGLIGGGESTSVDFVAPAPGTYPFLCTFPGHAVIMRGEMIVRPASAGPQI